jgi:ribosome biogenesis GTPase / thiamine phosphate phosphatase
MSDHHRHPSDGFVCKHCQRPNNPDPYGSAHRNHCCWCLWSLHVDDSPGDRASVCHGSMEPIGIWVKRDGEWALIHRCCSCGILKTNRIAGDDLPWALIGLAAKALARPPFPIDIPA